MITWLLAGAGWIQAAPVNFTLTGTVETADSGNGFGLAVGDTITVTGIFDDNALTGVGNENVLFSLGSGNSLNLVAGSKSFTEIDDINYSSGSTPPQLYFLNGSFEGFNYGAEFGAFGYFSSVGLSIVTGDDNFYPNRVTGTWTNYTASTAPNPNPAIQPGDPAPLDQPDGELNAGDVVVMERFVLGQLQPTPEQRLAADVAPLSHPDGQINVGDLVVLMRAVSGQVTLPLINVPSGGFAPPSLVLPPNQTQTSSLTLYGTASPQQNVNLYVNGMLAASVTADSLGDFQATVGLQQGPNSLYAVGLVGALEGESSNLVSVFYGTALPPVDWQQVTVTDLGSGQIQLVAQPGTVAAGTSVTLTSISGGTQTVSANADGSFTATLAGSGTTEPVTITVTDSAGNRSPASGNRAVGALSGTFLVNESGAATYTVPLDVPPGIAGMQPELSFNYNSQSGNGLMGIGWGLSGLSVITRCPRTWAQDAVYDGVSYDSNDRFCLDGQRLVNVSGSYGADGTVYRTEVDSFSLITQNGTSCGGPCGFTVQTRSGQTMVYGNSDNSRRNVSTTAAALSWAINTVTDARGNRLQFTYYKNTSGDHRIQGITYANTSPVRQVEFVYETRGDVARGYAAGSPVVSDQRLKTLRTRVGSGIVKEYRLTYETGSLSSASRITAIEECGFDPSGAAVCIPPTQFGWNDQTISTGFATTDTYAAPGVVDPAFRWTGDFDGDGKDEVATRVAGSINIFEWSAGRVAATAWTVPAGWGSAAFTWAADFNGDGMTDIASASGGSVYMKLATGGPDFQGATWPVLDQWGSGDYTWVADFNGDGRADIASASGTNVRMKLSTGSGFQSTTWTVPFEWGGAGYNWVGDYNGDGLADIISANGTNLYLKLSTGSGFVSKALPVTNNWSDTLHTWVADFNGDGLTDIATGTGTPLKVKLSTGSGVVEQNWSIPGFPSGFEVKRVLDYNGDGLADIGLAGSAVVPPNYVALSSGNGFRASFIGVGAVPGFWGGADGDIYFGDFDGDGATDVVRDWYTPLSGNWNLAIGLSSAYRDLVNRIQPAVGGAITLNYRSLATSSVKSSRCPGYPVQCIPLRIQAVEEHTVENGVGGIAQFGYYYSEPRVHVRGRGFLGFENRGVLDYQTGVSTQWYYETDTSQTLVDSYPDRYPYAGMASRMEAIVKRAGIPESSLPVNPTYDSMEVLEFALEQTTANTYFPYVRVKKENQHDLGSGGIAPSSEIVSTTTTTTDYDIYGNVERIVAQTVGGPTGYPETFTKTTVNQYDPADLRLGRLNRATVTTTTPDGTLTRTSGFTYYPDGLLRQEIIEPDEPDTSPLKQVTAYEYDSFGNKTKVSVTALAGDSPASGLQTRTTETRYDSNGLFPIRTLNALGHDEHYQYDPRFGLKTQLIGPNQLPTAWEYDALGRPVREIRADGTVTATDYAWCPASVCPYGGTRVIRETYGSPRTVVYRDAQDREIRAETEGLRPGSLIYQDTDYDQFGRVARKSRPYYAGDTPQWATFAYDKLDRLIEENRPDGGQIVYAYAPFTKTTTAYIVGGDVAQTAKTERFDAMGRLRQVVEELGVTTTFQYDPYDNLTTVTDNAGNVTTTQYDRRGRKIFMDDPDMGQWNYRYNGFGELTFQQDNALQQVTMTYDALGRMTRRVEPEGTTTWTYDTAPRGKGKLAQVNAPNGYTRTLGYDTLGRVATDARIIAGQTFQTAYAYDRFGRVTDTTYPSGFTTRNLYDPRGFLSEVRNAANDALYWQADDADADGQITRETYGNGLTTIRTYDPASGRIDMITTGRGTGSDYRYAERGAGPHAVTYANGQNYDYDANGNMLSGAGRTLTWSSYNKPVWIRKGATTVQFDYGPDRARFRQVKTVGSETTTTVYIGKRYEQISKGGTTEQKHYITAAGRVVAIYTDKGAGQTSTRYLHHDHLGSVDVITDESGAVVERLSFAAFGSRRNADWSDATGLITSQYTTRGFTGHEQLDEVGLVHMNGRVYDPVLGRFLSADPQVQFPKASQSFNRYSYVHNNPLSYTDPSGFGLFSGFKKLFKKIGSAIKKVFRNPVVRMIATVVASYFTFGYAAVMTGSGVLGAAAGGFVGGFIATGSLQGAVIGAATAAAFYGVGSFFKYARSLQGSASWGKGQLWFGKIVAHGTVGGASSVAQGGSFADGFRSAAFTQFGDTVIGSVPGGTIGRASAAAVVGGTASRLGGGKFANGAATGAFSRLFNEEAHPDDGGRIEMRQVGDRLFPVRVFKCATAECVAVGANLDLSDPGTQAFIRASDKPILDTIDNVETVFGSGAAGFGAAGQAGIALPAAGIAAGARALKVILTPPSPRQFGASVIDQAVSEAIPNPAGKAFVDIVGPTQRIEELTR